MIDFFQKYIQIETVYPVPRYEEAIALLIEQATQDGFKTKKIKLSSGFPALIITYEGRAPALPSLVLNHHMDVVPAPHTADWIAPPFAGEIHQNQVIGRGTQDMKGIGVIHYFALKALKDDGVQPQRTIHLIAVPDEERGGYGGAKLLLETQEFKELNVGYAIDEGCPSEDPSILYIKVDERKPLQIRITAKGERAHGSKLSAHNASHELVKVLNHIVTYHSQQQQQLPFTDASSLLSMNITSLQAGTSKEGVTTLNVISECATATVDIRIPSAMQIEDVKQWLHTQMRAFPSVTYQVEATVEERITQPTEETSLYQALAHCIAAQGLTAKPLITEGASDLRFYLKQGIEGIGFSPFTNGNLLHSINEAVTLPDMLRGKEIITQLLYCLCIH
ncbi:MAG: M20/M25/M40 family metallo-hydrolase [Parachlamydiaceae bacterium]